MARPRSFDEATAVRAAAAVFAEHGFEGTSVDDLITALQIGRGSLYATFGSKRALYLRVLREHVHSLPAPDLTLLLRAAVERAPIDVEAAALVRDGFDRLRPTTDDLARMLGNQLIARALVSEETP